MKRISLALLALISGASWAAADFSLEKPVNGAALEVNGQTFYKQSSDKVSARMARSLSLPTLQIGDQIQSEQDLQPAVVNGGLLVKLSDPSQVHALASAYGLKFKFRTDDIFLLQAAQGTELLQLLEKVQADSRVKQAQLELVRSDAVPQ